jgi:two-component system sensor histidine kinase CpxA
MLRTSEPAFYWVGVPLPLPDLQRLQPRLTLLAVSDSLRGGGLFFDYTPWLLTAGAVMVLSVVFWLPLVRGITRSLAQMTRATGEIAEGHFDARVADGRSDELGSLATAVNRMAERLAGFVSGQKRFLGDTAHELCAPIARMQMALGILEQRADEKQKPYVNDVREELQHISGLVNELLSFSKASLRPQPAALQSVNVAELARRVAERDGRHRTQEPRRLPGSCRRERPRACDSLRLPSGCCSWCCPPLSCSCEHRRAEGPRSHR